MDRSRRTAAYYANMVSPTSTRRSRGQQGPRRMGTDKNADVLWVGNSWGGNLARIDTRTVRRATCRCPIRTRCSPIRSRSIPSTRPGPTCGPPTVWRVQPDHRPVDDLRSAVARHRSRYISVDERDGRIKVIVPYARTSKIAVMTLRSEADIEAFASKRNDSRPLLDKRNYPSIAARDATALRAVLLDDHGNVLDASFDWTLKPHDLSNLFCPRPDFCCRSPPTSLAMSLAMAPIISISSLTKTYASGFQALKRSISTSPGRDFRAARAERSRQDHADRHRLRHRHAAPARSPSAATTSSAIIAPRAR